MSDELEMLEQLTADRDAAQTTCALMPKEPRSITEINRRRARPRAATIVTSLAIPLAAFVCKISPEPRAGSDDEEGRE